MLTAYFRIEFIDGRFDEPVRQTKKKQTKILESDESTNL